VSLFESAEPSYPAIARAVEAWADANDHDQLRAGEAVIAETEWAAADQVLDAIADEGLAAVTDVLEDADRTDEEAADTTAEAITLAVPPAMTCSVAGLVVSVSCGLLPGAVSRAAAGGEADRSAVAGHRP
jgi:hypothetical protein